MEAAVTERLARIGETVSTRARESRGLAFLGTIIVDPGIKSFDPKPKKVVSYLTDVPLGRMAYILDLSASFFKPPDISI